MRDLRFQAILAVLCFLWQPATLLAAPSQPQLHSHERVYLLRGWLNVFSLGMDKLGDELRQKNIEAVVGNHTLSGLYASEAIADCKSGKISSIAIVGHSLGASAAVSMAEQLAQAGVRVALIVTIDPVVETRVSRNVQTLKNFYFSNGVGRAVQRAPDFHGSLQNVDMKADSQLGHVSLANSETLHRQIFGYVSAAAGSRCR
jgi:hypothetical protein